MVTKINLIVAALMIPLISPAQLLEFHSAKKLPSAINTAGEEILPIMSPDGRQLFFARALYSGNTGGKFSGIDAWYSDHTFPGWKNPTNEMPGGVNDAGHNAIIGISRDGRKIFFLNAGTDEKVSGIYVVSKINNHWTRRELIQIPGIENRDFLGIHVSADADVILLSMKAPDSRGEEDLYFSVKTSTGQWTIPRNLGATINTTGFEISPFLSQDKKRLYFASNGHGGEGDADIFYSERLYNSWEAWTVPVNLGKQVNSKKFDAYFSIYGDSVAYFASNRDGKYADLYEVRVTQARTVLAPGQRYLSHAQWNRELGGTVSSEIVFPAGSTSLSASQKELLFYIANKLQLERGIYFHLIAIAEENSKATDARLRIVKDYLVQSGIAEERVIIEQVHAPEKAGVGKLQIRLIE